MSSLLLGDTNTAKTCITHLVKSPHTITENQGILKFLKGMTHDGHINRNLYNLCIKNAGLEKKEDFNLQSTDPNWLQNLIKDHNYKDSMQPLYTNIFESSLLPKAVNFDARKVTKQNPSWEQSDNKNRFPMERSNHL